MKKQNREKILLVAAAVCIGALLGDRLILQPAINTWNERSDAIASLEEQIFRGEALVEREDALRRKWSSMMESDLPSDDATAMNETLRRIDEIVQESRVRLTALQPGWQDGTDDDGLWKTLQVRASAYGSLEDLTRFIHLLETNPLPVRLESVEFGVRDKNSLELNMNMKFSGFQWIGKPSSS